MTSDDASGRHTHEPQVGLRGRRGLPGLPGNSPSVEAVAKEVSRHRIRMTDRRLLILYVVNIVGLALFVGRVETANHDVRREQHRVEVNTARINAALTRIEDLREASCRGGVEIIKNFNTSQDALAAIDRVNPNLDEKTRAARLAAYQRAKILPVPTCPPRPGQPVPTVPTATPTP